MGVGPVQQSGADAARPGDKVALLSEWNDEVARAQRANPPIPGAKVAEVGDVYAVTPSNGCGVTDWTGTHLNTTGQWLMGSGRTRYSHMMIEVTPKPDGTRQVYESNPGEGPKVNDLQKKIDKHGEHCQQVHRYAPNAPLDKKQIERLESNAEANENANKGYNLVIPFNRGKDGPEHCAQAVQNLQKQSGIPPFVEEKYGVAAPLPRDISSSPNYHRAPSDIAFSPRYSARQPHPFTGDAPVAQSTDMTPVPPRLQPTPTAPFGWEGLQNMR